MCFSPQRRTILRHPTFKQCSEDYSFLTFSLQNALFATAASMLRHPTFKKCSEDFFFNMFTSKCAFRHSGVQFCDIQPSKSAPRTTVFLTFSLQNVLFATAAYIFSTSASKSAPTMRCFEHVHFKMCFSPQRRAFFRHLNLQKRSHHEVF